MIIGGEKKKCADLGALSRGIKKKYHLRSVVGHQEEKGKRTVAL